MWFYVHQFSHLWQFTCLDCGKYSVWDGKVEIFPSIFSMHFISLSFPTFFNITSFLIHDWREREREREKLASDHTCLNLVISYRFIRRCKLYRKQDKTSNRVLAPNHLMSLLIPLFFGQHFFLLVSLGSNFTSPC